MQPQYAARIPAEHLGSCSISSGSDFVLTWRAKCNGHWPSLTPMSSIFCAFASFTGIILFDEIVACAQYATQWIEAKREISQSQLRLTAVHRSAAAFRTKAYPGFTVLTHF